MFNRTRLIAAVHEGDLRKIRACISSGCDLNEGDEKGATPLQHAVKEDKLDIVRILVEAGARTDVADVFQRGLLYTAVKLNRPNMIRALVSAGCDVNETFGGLTLLDEARANGSSHNYVVQVLLEAGAGKEGKSQIYIPSLPPSSVCTSNVGNSTRSEVGGQIYLPSQPPASVWGADGDPSTRHMRWSAATRSGHQPTED